MSILNPTQLSTAAQVIATETAAGANTASRIGGMSQDIIDSGVFTVKVSLSSAEILALATTPKVLVAAQGAGTLIRPLAITFNLTYVSTTYTGGAMRIYYSTGGSFLVSNSTYTNGSSVPYYGTISNTVALATGAINDDLIMDAASAVSVGDGTLDVYITYAVISI